jgi:uncharacterized membrane protein
VKTNSETEKKMAKNLRLNNRGYKIAVAVVLIFVFSLLVGYYFYVHRLSPEGYTTIYVLNYQEKKAVDYPELVVINENNTFSVWVEVENHMGAQQSCEILQKVVKGMVPSFPVEVNAEKSYAQTVDNGKTWEIPATVTINEPGSYSVIFELWIYDANAEAFKFSYNFCVLPIDVVNQT